MGPVEDCPRWCKDISYVVWFVNAILNNGLIVLLKVLVAVMRGVVSKHDNFCRPLEDYGPREDVMEERKVCKTSFEKDCQPVTESDCMEVTELRCEVREQEMNAMAA